eukprot:356979-Chlamydomonas_euryale.AAC.3
MGLLGLLPSMRASVQSAEHHAAVQIPCVCKQSTQLLYECLHLYKNKKSTNNKCKSNKCNNISNIDKNRTTTTAAQTTATTTSAARVSNSDQKQPATTTAMTMLSPMVTYAHTSVQPHTFSDNDNAKSHGHLCPYFCACPHLDTTRNSSLLCKLGSKPLPGFGSGHLMWKFMEQPRCYAIAPAGMRQAGHQCCGWSKAAKQQRAPMINWRR